MPSHKPLHLQAQSFQFLLKQLGPSLGLWRAAEVAVLCQQAYERPILEVGCGDGLVTSMVLPQVEIGVDPNPIAKKAYGLNLYKCIEQAPVESVHIAPGSIATVISNSVLEHVPQIEAVLQAISRMLKRNGRLVFTVPTEFFSAWLTLPIASYAAWRNKQLCHLNLWPLKRWSWQLDRVGLAIEQVYEYLPRRFVTLWDILELMQQIWIAQHRLASLVWHRLPPGMLKGLARTAAKIDLAAPSTGGGRLIVARKR